MNLKVLVVDDEVEITDFLEMIMSMNGFDVTSANSGSEAFSKYQSTKFDLVITDFRMPNGNGFELIKNIEKVDVEKRTKIIFISGQTGGTDEEIELLNRHIRLFKPEDVKIIGCTAKALFG